MVELTITKIYDSKVLWLQSAGFWSLVGGSVVGYYVKIPQRATIAAMMAFGAGVVISAWFEPINEADQRGGFDSTAIGFVSGAVVYTDSRSFRD